MMRSPFLLSTLLLTVFPALGTAQCLNSTQALFLAQVMDAQTKPPSETKTYVVCPDTTIQIGIPNADLTATESGDFPLLIIQDNVEILCGEDGSSANNCVFTDGNLQFATLGSLPQFGIPSVTTNNLKISGFTFTGILTASTIFARSMLFSAPGTNMIVEDCHFINMATQILLSIEPSSLAVAPPDSVELTVKDCTFTNIDYTDDYAIWSYEQILNIVNTTFNNVQYTGERDCSCDDSFFLLCSGGATCSIQDSCFDDISFTAGLIHESNGTTITTDNLYLGPGGITALPSNLTLVCDQGFSDNSVPGNGAFEVCMSPFTADFCSVTPPPPTFSPTTTPPPPTFSPTTTPGPSAASLVQSSGLVVAAMVVASLVGLLDL